MLSVISSSNLGVWCFSVRLQFRIIMSSKYLSLYVSFNGKSAYDLSSEVSNNNIVEDEILLWLLYFSCSLHTYIVKVWNDNVLWDNHEKPLSLGEWIELFVKKAGLSWFYFGISWKNLTLFYSRERGLSYEKIIGILRYIIGSLKIWLSKYLAEVCNFMLERRLPLYVYFNNNARCQKYPDY